MKTTIKTNIIIAVFLSFILTPLDGLALGTDRGAARVINGELDLSQYNLNDGPFYLDGQWQFVWGKLLSPTDWHQYKPDTPIATYKVPGTWKGGPYHDATLTGMGHATYHLHIKNPKDNSPTATLNIPYAQTAYRLWVNGLEIASNGTVGTSEETSTPGRLTYSISFPLVGDETEIVYQISNYHMYDGGIRKYFLFGTESAIQHHHDIRLLYSVACVGMLSLFGIYLILIYIFRRSEKAHLYFGLTSISLALYTISVDTSIITIVWPELSWFFQIKVANSSAAMTLGFALIYIVYLFPKDSSKRFSQFGVAVSLFTAASSFIPAFNESTATYPYYTFFIVICLLYGLGVFIKASINRRRGSLLVITPYLLMISVTIFDIYLYQTGQEVYNLAGYGFILFMVTNIYLLAKKYSDSYSQTEKLENSLRQANAMKDEFLATTSHELRTPLNGIIGLSESVLEHLNSTELKDNLKLIIANARRLAGLVSNTLDVTRLQHNDVDFLPKAIDISTVSRSVMQLCHPLMNDSELQFDYHIENTLPAILADENHLQQILYNLIGNAIKYTPSGTITLDAVQHDQMLHISICDTGIGIAPHEINQIFEPYTQVSTDKQAVQQGIGLGLPITQKLIELNGGTLDVESEPGNGSCFTVILPITDESYSQPESQTKSLFIENNHSLTNDSEKKHNVPSSSKTILAVDDESVNLAVLTAQLEHAGHRILSASSGAEALSYIENEAIDLVLLDVMMPGMNGLEVCRRVREEYEAVALPIILLTARSQPDDIIEGFSAGANDYITKPFYRQELLARVDAALSVKDNEQLNWVMAQREHAIDQLEYAQHHIGERMTRHGYRVLIIQIDGTILESASSNSIDQAESKIEYSDLPTTIKDEIKKWKKNPLSYLQENSLEIDSNGSSIQYHCFASTLLNQPVLTLLLESSDTAIETEQDTTCDPRLALLDLMINALDCWERNSDKGKIELAEESQIWTVHIDGSTAKTRTLDKYLRLDTIPARPRWKNVSRTAQFVINNNEATPCAEQLKQQLDQFYELMKVVQF